MKLRVRGIDRVSTTMFKSLPELVIECRMDEEEMYAALGEFLERITDAKWDEWVKRLNEEMYERKP